MGGVSLLMEVSCSRRRWIAPAGDRILNCLAPPPPAPPLYLVQHFSGSGALDVSYGQSGTNSTPSQAGGAAILADGTAISLGSASGQGMPYTLVALVVDP